MAKRKLSAEEKTWIIEERRTKEVSAHPSKMISVRVEDETDANGEPIVLGPLHRRVSIEGLEAQCLSAQG
jgi:hypothetical protein